MFDINTITLKNDTIIAADLEYGSRMTRGGILIGDDDMKNTGIRPRWCKVLKTSKSITETVPGDFILVEHGRWSRGFDVSVDDEKKTARFIDKNCILLVSKAETDEYKIAEKK